ncbi:Rab21 [Thecamonas trahens ATCC 50062]|uniref:Ras-related protein Rab-21 n=1 Tax=Thecamonas trahens ATCC 50062 TaxID=461836 RepID=A0A0L0DAJ9_THETB|nr:Rab21 [Thecamonas trahens ATCC 50062]KNC49265.1 Rab21 [Thecamonas trahens ATCC 50062]|eukprot:XP_013757979.1 Rab21 [Thecamonas trahens ATCC 50062]
MAAESSFKVVLLGEGCVGKTSLINRYTRNAFVPDHKTTLQASFQEKRLNIGGKRVKLAIWDTAGQERFHALGPIYYRDANGALLVYDITDTESFLKVKNWVKELRTMLGKDVVLTIAANKSDLERSRQVDEAEADRYAASVGASHIHTSAKADRNVKEVFLDLTKRMLESVDAASASSGTRGRGRRGGAPPPSGRGSGPILIAADEPDPYGAGPSKKKCC